MIFTKTFPMKKSFLFLSAIVFFFIVCFVQGEALENISYANLTNDLKKEMIVEKTISPKEGLSETKVSIYKRTNDETLKLIWSGIKRLGFLSVLDRLPPYEDTLELPFCLVSDISMIDIDEDGVMEIKMTTKKVYYDRTRSRIVEERPVHIRIFSWDVDDQRYE